jgi:hypothetical protein
MVHSLSHSIVSLDNTVGIGFGLTGSWLDGEGLARRVRAASEAEGPDADIAGEATEPDGAPRASSMGIDGCDGTVDGDVVAFGTSGGAGTFVTAGVSSDGEALAVVALSPYVGE